MRIQETELQTQLLLLQQETARLYDLLDQIRSASESVDIRNSWMSAPSKGVEFGTQTRPE